jgi:hypothetical protein
LKSLKIPHEFPTSGPKGVFESAQEVVWSATRDAGSCVPWPMGKCGKIMGKRWGNGLEIWVNRRFLWENII